MLPVTISPRADQLQPARSTRSSARSCPVGSRGARRDRQGVPHLHAPPGRLQVAVATVVFPTLSRFAARRAYDDLRATMANGMRMILLVLDAGGRGDPRPLRADDRARLPARRLLRERHRARRRGALLVRLLAAFNGLFLLMTRTFFSLQRPWVPTWIAGVNLALTAGFCGRLLRALRHRRHRRRHGDRDGRQRRRPGGRPARAARRHRDPRLLIDGADADHARLGRARGRLLPRLGPASTPCSATGTLAQIDRVGGGLAAGARRLPRRRPGAAGARGDADDQRRPPPLAGPIRRLR